MVQLYVGKSESQIDRPEKELKAFTKTRELAPGERTEITLNVPLAELRYWDENTSGWTLEEGLYEVELGTSSRDISIREEVDISIKQKPAN